MADPPPLNLPIQLHVNGKAYTRAVQPRLLLSDFLRHELGLTGTHIGCEQGVCGTCTIHLDGEPVRSCLLLAVQCDGSHVTTVEGLSEANGGELTPLQESFHQCHALQCGFCTPGMLMTLTPFLQKNPEASDSDIRGAIAGNLCRCTGYQHIVEAAAKVLDTLRRQKEEE